MMDKNTKIYVNPTGRFVVGGPHGDAGVTGRKIIVDTYGGAAPHGGGAFSGKDPTKVDRSACYMARYIAKNVVAAGIAERALVQLAYAIGVADPVSVMVHTEGTGRIPEEKITEIVRAALQADAARHHGRARPAPADLQEDRGVRTLRPHRDRSSTGSGPTRPRRSRRRPACSRAVVSLSRQSVKKLVLVTAALVAAVAVFVGVTLPPRPLPLAAARRRHASPASSTSTPTDPTA